MTARAVIPESNIIHHQEPLPFLEGLEKCIGMFEADFTVLGIDACVGVAFDDLMPKRDPVVGEELVDRHADGRAASPENQKMIRYPARIHDQAGEPPAVTQEIVCGEIDLVDGIHTCMARM